jgi:hypothetical protein
MSYKNLYDPVAIILLTCGLTRRSLTEGTEDKETSPTYTVSIDPLRKAEHPSAICRIKVASHDVDRAYSTIRASYLIAFQSETSTESAQAIGEIVERAVNNVVWPRFSDLFSLIVSQANMDLPRLPARPNKIENLISEEK